ncbi:hypothetical protein WMY93_032910 [Mugilogobius chulae]|uniref:TAFH domain-containing protein n=1 Tax=Mugilogobius chulae TaxID=88201 RepID=A0AAW0MII1_9GOBI
MATNRTAEGSKPICSDSEVKIVSSLSPAAAAAAVVKVVPSAVPGLALRTSSSSDSSDSASSGPSPSVILVTKMAAPGGVRSSAVQQQVTKTTLSSTVQLSPSSPSPALAPPPPHAMAPPPAPAPGRTVVITVPRAAPAAPRVATTTTTTTTHLPSNLHIPPGMMLIRSGSGQLMLVSQQAWLRPSSRPHPQLHPHPPSSLLRLLLQATPRVAKTNDKLTLIRMTAPQNLQPPVQKTLLKVQTRVGASPKLTLAQSLNQPRILTSVPEPKKEATPTFKLLVTLIKLASSDSRSANMATTSEDWSETCWLEADEFTQQLYRELRSTPQPCLVPFLRSPAVRILTPDPELFIQQAATKTPSVPNLPPTQPNSPSFCPYTLLLSLVPPSVLSPSFLSLVRPSVLRPSFYKCLCVFYLPGTLPMRVSSEPRPTSKSTSGSYKEDDDINDVASMAGVNLREENAQILTSHVGAVVQSCQDQPFLAPKPLLTRILHKGQPLGVTEVESEVVELVSHASQEFLRTLLEKLSVMAQHRKNLMKNDWLHSKVSDVRAQLKFLEDVETLRKKRKDEEERERLLRLARSRSHVEDPELLLLKQKAKEMQLLEQAALQQREANMAALAAIGPRKKRSLELDSQVCVLPRPGVPRVTRVILRDLLQCLEQDRRLRHSVTLYRGLQGAL